MKPLNKKNQRCIRAYSRLEKDLKEEESALWPDKKHIDRTDPHQDFIDSLIFAFKESTMHKSYQESLFEVIAKINKELNLPVLYTPIPDRDSHSITIIGNISQKGEEPFYIQAETTFTEDYLSTHTPNYFAMKAIERYHILRKRKYHERDINQVALGCKEVLGGLVTWTLGHPSIDLDPCTKDTYYIVKWERPGRVTVSYNISVEQLDNIDIAHLTKICADYLRRDSAPSDLVNVLETLDAITNKIGGTSYFLRENGKIKFKWAGSVVHTLLDRIPGEIELVISQKYFGPGRFAGQYNTEEIAEYFLNEFHSLRAKYI